MLKSTLVVVTIAAFLSASASAAPPLKRLAWAKITAAYVAQAKAHGAAATCTPWGSSPAAKYECAFGTGGQAVRVYWDSACTVAVSVWAPRSATDTRVHMVTQKVVPSCGVRWWQRPLPAPWS